MCSSDLYAAVGAHLVERPLDLVEDAVHCLVLFDCRRIGQGHGDQENDGGEEVLKSCLPHEHQVSITVLAVFARLHAVDLSLPWLPGAAVGHAYGVGAILNWGGIPVINPSIAAHEPVEGLLRGFHLVLCL
mgnify:CR=1 FL=1